MSKTKETDHAKRNAEAWMECIREQVGALHNATEGDDQQAIEAAETAIREGPLCVEVRSDWYSPGQAHESVGDPAEYLISLSTGGPALRLIGGLDGGCPDSARLEYQDWGTPWTELRVSGDDETALTTYASQFYFGD